MTTFRGVARIPAVTVGLLGVGVFSLALVACSSSNESSDPTITVTQVSTAVTSTAVTVAPETAVAPEVTSAPEITVAPTSTVAPEVTVSNDIVISVIAGIDSGEDRVENVPLGATITLTVINPDRDDEFHVHGYELGDGIEIPAGQPEIFTFVADQAGQFEVESHTTEVVLLVLNVG